MTTALVTGADGFVGANLVRRLLSAGREVIAISRPEGNRWRLADVEHRLQRIECDLRDEAAVQRLVAATRPQSIFHLAAYGAYSWQHDARRIVETNLLATIALARAAQDNGVRAFVHAGSSSEYGPKDHAPAEDEAIEPNSVYAVAKAAATLHCAHVARSADAHVVTLRLYSVYGPWEEPNRLATTLVAHALRGTLPPFANPMTARDFVYVDDAVDAFVLAAERTDCPRGAVYNIGSGRQTTLAELAEIAGKLFELDVKPAWGSFPDRDWDTDRWIADPQRASAELGWAARHTLDQGLAKMADWMAALPDAAERYGPRGSS